MARLEKKNYKSIQKNELNDPVVFVVDMIKGFVNMGPSTKYYWSMKI